MKCSEKTKTFLSLFLLFTFVILIAGCPTNPLAQEKIPNTHAGRRLKESLYVVDSHNYDSVRAYVADNFTPDLINLFSMDWLTRFYMNLLEVVKHFDFYSVKKSSGTRITGIFKNKHTGLRLDLVFTVQSRSPHKIRGIDLILLRPLKGT